MSTSLVRRVRCSRLRHLKGSRCCAVRRHTYGKNTIGGAIKYVTKPISNTFEGRITWNPGTFNTQEIRANFSGPFVRTVLGKASFAKLTRDGYGENLYQEREVSNKDTTAYRLALEWLPSDKVSVRADSTTQRTTRSRSV